MTVKSDKHLARLICFGEKLDIEKCMKSVVTAAAVLFMVNLGIKEISTHRQGFRISQYSTEALVTTSTQYLSGPLPEPWAPTR